MEAHELNLIERELGITLPEYYRFAMVRNPDFALREFGRLWIDPHHIVQQNRTLRAEPFNWPLYYIAVGQSGGDILFVDVTQRPGPVFEAEPESVIDSRCSDTFDQFIESGSMSDDDWSRFQAMCETDLDAPTIDEHLAPQLSRRLIHAYFGIAVNIVAGVATISLLWYGTTQGSVWSACCGSVFALVFLFSLLLWLIWFDALMTVRHVRRAARPAQRDQ